ncbi:monovalent cation/H(+) antiporter subunit G [Pelagibacterium montanilacus]|uniref:monovalent cation/H(+) antiporter subunit G n=1 Tax=Pelagibacterium montanilacus TaxID=2185280 RepID=UPI000F8E70CE|nr:monovalent cation/H(+) antiporter subunit G [Pelagibacterium montanilacus]
MIDLLYYAAGVMLIVGALFSFLAVVGILRLPDLYTRAHAASKAGTVGSGLTLIAIALVSFDVSVALRAVVGIVFFMLTAPISAHLLSRAAYIAGYMPHSSTVLNELADAQKGDK